MDANRHQLIFSHSSNVRLSFTQEKYGPCMAFLEKRGEKKKSKTMKKELEVEDEHELEILKAVAQAWHGHSGNSRPTNEFDAYRHNFKSKPTRFRLEAMNKSLAKDAASSKWDFEQSLWDSYEIVAVSKRLETGLVLDHDFSSSDDPVRLGKRNRESKNSLRNLFNRVSSRRFSDES